jgi:pimeloyl-ACP methyl ester carboxylesterase
MSPSGRRGLVGLGVGLGVAGAATAAGIVTDRLNRRLGEALETGEGLTMRPTREIAVLADDGVPLHVEVDEPLEGSDPQVDGTAKPTVVLSHGYCLTSECWVFQRRALSRAGYRVVVWDQRGHGRSEKGAKESYTIDQLGEDLFRVIAATAPEGPLALVGHSMGGMTTMALGASHPDVIKERVTAFGCISTSPGGLPLANGDLGASAGRILLERLGPRIAGLFESRPEILKTILRANKEVEEFLVERYSFHSPVPRSVIQLTAKMLLGTDLSVMSSFTPAFGAYDKTAALAYFDGVETLVFNGEHDVLTPPEHSEAIVRAIPGAEHVIVRDAGHVIMLEHPELLNEQLEMLFERAVRAQDRDVELERKPPVRRVVTDLGKRRRIERGLERRRSERPARRNRRGHAS